MVKIDFRMKRSGVPILRKAEIEAIAERLLGDYNPKVWDEACPVDIDHFSESYVGLEMDYQDLSPNQSILGMMVFDNCLIPVYDAKNKVAKYIRAAEGTVLIDNSLLMAGQIQRERFTIGHEVAHWLLHRDKYKPRKGPPLSTSQVSSFVKCRTWEIERPRRKLTTDDDWMEWQADYMASALLMPRRLFSQVVLQRFARIGLKTDYYVRGTDISLDLWIDYLSYELADRFNVSVTAAKIRLENLGLVWFIV
jgi:Zn-dependent peptidase ImmA (M78 family)